MTEKPKTLRELIAEDHEQFWVWIAPKDADTTNGVTGERWMLESVAWASFCDYNNIPVLDCPAIPILKPTVTL